MLRRSASGANSVSSCSNEHRGISSSSCSSSPGNGRILRRYSPLGRTHSEDGIHTPPPRWTHSSAVYSPREDPLDDGSHTPRCIGRHVDGIHLYGGPARDGIPLPWPHSLKVSSSFADLLVDGSLARFCALGPLVNGLHLYGGATRDGILARQLS